MSWYHTWRRRIGGLKLSSDLEGDARLGKACRDRPRAASGAVDRAALADLEAMLGGCAAAKVTRLLGNFYPGAANLLADARRALASGAVARLHLAAHTLKSNAATFGATRLALIAHQLEKLASGPALDGASELIEQAEVEFQRAKKALQKIYPAE